MFNMTYLFKKIIRLGSPRTAIFLPKFNKQNISVIEKYAQIGQIYSGIIHDLISPITALGMQIDLINEKNIDRRKHIKFIRETITGINEYSKIVKNYISMNQQKRWLDLSKEIEKSLKLISYSAIQNNIQINFIRKEKVKIFSNRIKIYQIIISLVSNAIESFREKDSNRKIIIKIEKIKNKTIISITDFGQGIENTDIIFSPFYTTKKDKGGTGIGLSSVRHIVEKDLKGKIIVNSKPDEGSTFKIIL